MANSNIIGKLKKQIISKIISDKDIVKAIDSKIVNKAENLINKNVFDYDQNPETLNLVGTFITVQVHIPVQRYNTEITFVQPIIEIKIISHERHMIIDNIPKMRMNRPDYISELLDNKFNGEFNFSGIGKLVLKSNVEGCYIQNYQFRKLTFGTVDLNNSLCNQEV